MGKPGKKKPNTTGKYQKIQARGIIQEAYPRIIDMLKILSGRPLIMQIMFFLLKCPQHCASMSDLRQACEKAYTANPRSGAGGTRLMAVEYALRAAVKHKLIDRYSEPAENGQQENVFYLPNHWVAMVKAFEMVILCMDAMIQAGEERRVLEIERDKRFNEFLESEAWDIPLTVKAIQQELNPKWLMESWSLDRAVSEKLLRNVVFPLKLSEPVIIDGKPLNLIFED